MLLPVPAATPAPPLPLPHHHSYSYPAHLTPLRYVADITRAFGGSDVRDAIVTVPAFFTHHERKAIVDAAEISGMKVLATIDENAAAALHYGLDRVHDEPKTVLIYNMGSNAAQASVHRYSSYAAKEMGKNKTVGMFETVGKGWDDGLGGYAFASLLVEHIADAFNEKWGKGDIRTIPRAMAKISNHAKKTKEVRERRRAPTRAAAATPPTHRPRLPSPRCCRPTRSTPCGRSSCTTTST